MNYLSINSSSSVAGVSRVGQFAGSDQLLDHILHLLPIFRRLSKHADSHPAVAMDQEHEERRTATCESFSDTETDDNDNDNSADHCGRDPWTSGSC